MRSLKQRAQLLFRPAYEKELGTTYYAGVQRSMSRVVDEWTLVEGRRKTSTKTKNDVRVAGW